MNNQHRLNSAMTRRRYQAAGEQGVVCASVWMWSSGTPSTVKRPDGVELFINTSDRYRKEVIT